MTKRGQKPSAPAKPAAVPEAVAQAEALLEACKSGKVKAFAAAMVFEGHPVTGSVSGIANGDVLSAKLLIAAMEELRHEWQHVVSGRR